MRGLGTIRIDSKWPQEQGGMVILPFRAILDRHPQTDHPKEPPNTSLLGHVPFTCPLWAVAELRHVHVTWQQFRGQNLNGLVGL